MINNGRDRQYRNVPTIVVSGGMDDGRDTLKGDPNVEFLAKPVDYAALCSRIEHALTGSYVSAADQGERGSPGLEGDSP